MVMRIGVASLRAPTTTISLLILFQSIIKYGYGYMFSSNKNDTYAGIEMLVLHFACFINDKTFTLFC